MSRYLLFSTRSERPLVSSLQRDLTHSTKYPALRFCFLLALSLWLGVSEVRAQDDDELEDRKVAVSVAPAGVQRFAHGGWSSIVVVGSNPTDEPAEEAVSVYIKESPDVQFSVKFWIPPNSKRQTWLPIAVPSREVADGDRITLSMIRLNENESGESFSENLNDMPVLNRELMLLDNEINTGLITNSFKLVYDSDEQFAMETLNRVVNVARDSTTSTPSDYPLINFFSNLMPPTHKALDELDQLVIAGDHLLVDSKGLTAVRSWIRRGGRAWIMLDRTSEKLVAELMDGDTGFSVVDELELNDYVIEFIDPFTKNVGRDDPYSREVPVNMLRVLTDAEDVPCYVDVWPAAFWVPFGDGEILFTTLAGEGWISEDDKAGSALNQISRRFFEPKVNADRFVEALRPIVDEKIGYSIPSRSIAGFVLAINAVVILVAGVVWIRQRRLERMAILIPVSALATTMIMLGIGTQNARSVPSTVATGQVVQFRAESGEADISTVRATYSQQAGDLDLVSKRNVLSMPLDYDGDAKTKRVRFDEDGSIRWSGAEQPPGVVRHIASDVTLASQQSVSVRGTFNEDGFVAKLTGIDVSQCEDALVVAEPAPMIAAKLDPNDESAAITATPDDGLAAGQFIPGSILSDQQRTRQAFLRNAFSSDQQHSLGLGPALLVWTDPLDVGEEFAERFERKGTALVSVPIQIDLPELDVDFRVPSTFIRTDGFRGEQGRSTIFDPKTGEWVQDLTKASETGLIFRFPAAIAGMDLQRVKVSMKANAPARTLFVKGMTDDGPVIVFEQENVTGPIEFEIDRKEVLQMHSEGGLWLSVGVTESLEAAELRAAATDKRLQVEETTTWQIDFFHIDAVGRLDSSKIPSS